MNILAQIAIVLGISLCAEAIASVLPFVFPSSIIGMLLLLLLLLSGVLKTVQIQSVSGFLLANIAVLFVPAGVSVLRYWDILAANWLPIFLVCLLSTPIVYAVTAWSVKATMKLVDRSTQTEKERNAQ
ncbi:MAG: CidA/LrgA family protein [Oscillospiraceae bacterium]|nr:CidA/LrgA family protein [Oscillospiraceae bacterium]